MTRKAIILGIDAAKSNYIDRFIKKGILPNLAKMRSKGVYRDLISTIPAITSSSWQSMVTGAWPDVHGVPGFELNLSDTPIDKTVQAWQPKYYRAETIVETAERNSKFPITLNWPGSRGPNPLVKKGIQIGGLVAGGYTIGEIPIYSISDPVIAFTPNTNPLPYFKTDSDEYVKKRLHPVSLKKAQGWKNLETEIDKAYEAKVEVAGNVYYLLLTKKDGRNVIYLADNKKSKLLAKAVRKGTWSGWISQLFTLHTKKIRGYFKFKVLDASFDAKRLRVYLTGINITKRLIHPRALEKELIGKFGPFLEQHDDMTSLRSGAIDGQTFLELITMQKNWLSNIGEYLLENNKWDLFMSFFPSIDHIQHSYLGLQNIADPAYQTKNPNYSKASSAKALKVIQDVYRTADQWIGNFLKHIDGDTTMIVVSDHGQVPCYASVCINMILQRAGLLRYQDNTGTIVASKTQAYFWSANHINVNAKGRYPKGAVAKNQYEDVRQKVIDALEKVVDPASGKRCIRAFRREELSHLGINSVRAGDVMFFLRPGIHTYAGLGRFKEIFQRRVEGAHAPVWPTHRDLRGVFFAYGKGIKNNANAHRPFIRPVDIAPTLSKLLNIPEPAQCVGKSIL